MPIADFKISFKIFDFECYQCGHIHEEIVELDIKNLPCPKCNGLSRQIISLGHGGLQTDTNATWLDSACKVLLRPGGKPLQTRDEYKRYLKQNDIHEKGGDARIDGKYSML
jgi:hypothetical protein